MANGRLRSVVTSSDPALRDLALDQVCAGLQLPGLLAECAGLEELRRESPNLYERARAAMMLAALHRYHIPRQPTLRFGGRLPYDGVSHLLEERYEEAIYAFLQAQAIDGACDAISSGLAAAYHRIAFRTLADQVRRSVRSVRGNQWLFRITHPLDQPLAIVPLLRVPVANAGSYPVLREQTPVRMDLSHSAWSDIFFLGMDHPTGARVLNVSVDLGVHGRDAAARPPVESYLRVIDEPVLRLASVDLGAYREIRELAEVFDFGRDHLGLLKAAMIAAGVVPPGLEGSGAGMPDLLRQLVGPGHGLELVSSVNGIPKGSRLAVSTTLLASLVSLCMRATGQTMAIEGGLSENERRTVASRAILGEWLAGSGGGWQDSGGVWPGCKLIEGRVATDQDPEWGISLGRLLPGHRPLEFHVDPAGAAAALKDSLVLVHGGMAQNVGPILEMVTEKYLLRSGAEWEARREAGRLFDEIVDATASGDIRRLASATLRNYDGPIRTIIPWAANCYTDGLIEGARRGFGDQFWGFLMLGGMSGGGMGFFFNPSVRDRASGFMLAAMEAAQDRYREALPFAMRPVVYDFAVNDRGTWASLCPSGQSAFPPGYYRLILPDLLRQDPAGLSAGRRSDLAQLGRSDVAERAIGSAVQVILERLSPLDSGNGETGPGLGRILADNGFDRVQHEELRAELRAGRIGLAQNRLPISTTLTDVGPDVVRRMAPEDERDLAREGQALLASGAAAVVTLAGGGGSRWTDGAGIVKAVQPFVLLDGRYRSFLDVHLAKSRFRGDRAGAHLPHIVTTSYLTDPAVGEWLAGAAARYPGELLRSPGRSIGLRMVPTARDLSFLWMGADEEAAGRARAVKLGGAKAAMVDWAISAGEASDYTDNGAAQCLCPMGHWYEVPNLLRNGVLAGLLARRPQLRYLFVHSIDAVGADLDPALLALHARTGSALGFEVTPRRVEDQGGGLAMVDGRPRLVADLALPRKEQEFGLTYSSTLSTWVSIDQLLAAFGLERADLARPERVQSAVRNMAQRIPTYVAIRKVKKRWGHGQEDVLPVAQYEKLWGDMTAVNDLSCTYLAVPRTRGHLLRYPAQLDAWCRDGSAAAIAAVCCWAEA